MIHPSVKIHPSAHIDCVDLTIGAGSVIGADCTIEGTSVAIGREAWLDVGAHIGGGSCHDPQASLVAGDWLHMGRGSHINIARGVTIGHECGVGIDTKVFTHGAYQSEWDGFPVSFAPVTIGDHVWLPNAWVNPGVSIGSYVVVAARSLVNCDIPDHCLAGGSPAKVLKADCYPQVLTASQQLDVLKRLCSEINLICGEQVAYLGGPLGVLGVMVAGEETLFDLHARTIEGPATAWAAVAQNQLRRHGIRFRYAPIDGRYAPWLVS